MARKVTFAKNYDHRWPSRATTAFKAGWSGPVKDEVYEGAKAAGALSDEEAEFVATDSDALPTTRAELEKLAGDEGVDVAAIEGTGSRGYVTNEDIGTAILASRAAPKAPPVGDAPSGAEADATDAVANGD